MSSCASIAPHGPATPLLGPATEVLDPFRACLLGGSHTGLGVYTETGALRRRSHPRD